MFFLFVYLFVLVSFRFVLADNPAKNSEYLSVFAIFSVFAACHRYSVSTAAFCSSRPLEVGVPNRNVPSAGKRDARIYSQPHGKINKIVLSTSSTSTE